MNKDIEAETNVETCLRELQSMHWLEEYGKSLEIREYSTDDDLEFDIIYTDFEDRTYTVPVRADSDDDFVILAGLDRDDWGFLCPESYFQYLFLMAQGKLNEAENTLHMNVVRELIMTGS